MTSETGPPHRTPSGGFRWSFIDPRNPRHRSARYRTRLQQPATDCSLYSGENRRLVCFVAETNDTPSRADRPQILAASPNQSDAESILLTQPTRGHTAPAPSLLRETRPWPPPHGARSGSHAPGDLQRPRLWQVKHLSGGIGLHNFRHRRTAAAAVPRDMNRETVRLGRPAQRLAFVADLSARLPTGLAPQALCPRPGSGLLQPAARGAA